MVAFVGRHGVLITPTAPVAPYPVEKRYVDEIDGEKLATYLDWLVLGYAITVTGCPAISIPCGLPPTGPAGRPAARRARPYGEARTAPHRRWCETRARRVAQGADRPARHAGVSEAARPR